MKDLKISSLNDIYGGLLTDRQAGILKHYYDYDLSYGEIAEIFGITRQAVGQIIEISGKQLESYETALKLFEILERLKSLRQDTNDQDAAGYLDGIIALIADKT